MHTSYIIFVTVEKKKKNEQRQREYKEVSCKKNNRKRQMDTWIGTYGLMLGFELAFLSDFSSEYLFVSKLSFASLFFSVSLYLGNESLFGDEWLLKLLSPSRSTTLSSSSFSVRPSLLSILLESFSWNEMERNSFSRFLLLVGNQQFRAEKRATIVLPDDELNVIINYQFTLTSSSFGFSSFSAAGSEKRTLVACFWSVAWWWSTMVWT